MAINVGTLALSISVNEQEVLNKLRRIDAAAAKVGSGKLAGAAAAAAVDRTVAAKTVATHTAAEKAKTAATVAEEGKRNRIRAASARIGGPGLGMVGITSTVVGVAATRGLISAINDVQTLRQRLIQVAESQEQARFLFDRMAESAGRLRVPITDATELFVKLRQSNQALGLTVGDTQKVTEAFSAALRISGATGQAAASSLLQFGQAMAKGKLDGDEFRTVAENASEVLRVLERRLGATRGQILKWREEGKLTAKMMSDALIAEYDNLIDRVNRLPPTLQQATTAFRTSVLKMIADSKDLEDATNKIAQGIVDLGKAVEENGPLIRGLGRLAVELTAVYAVMKLIKAIGSIPALLTGGGPFGFALKGLAIATGAFFIGLEQQKIAIEQEKKAIDDRIKAFADEYEAMKKRAKHLREHGNDVAQILRAQSMVDARRQTIIKEMQDATLALGRAEIAAGPKERRTMEGAEAVYNAQQVYNIKKRTYDLTVGAERMLASGGGAVQPAPEDTKKAKDTTDQFIAQSHRLAEANSLREQEFVRLNQILTQSRSIIASGTADTEKFAQAKAREAEIMEILNMLYGENVMLGERTLMSDLQQIATISELGLVTRQQLTLVQELQAKELESLRTGELSDEQKRRSLEILKQTNAVLEEQRKKINALIVAMNALAGVGVGGNGISQEMASWKQGLESAFLQVPTDLFVGFFGGLGEQFSQGGSALRDRMLSVIGNLMIAVGTAMLPFGVLLTKLAKKLANPFTAGPAAIAIGATLIAMGAALSAASQSAMRGNSNAGLGGIGGLGIGGATGTQPFVFQNRPYQNPMQGMGSTPDARGNVTVNATIIGPNDPQAQRQIADLVNNASRRGLMTGSAMRTR